jgi:hypothetical protein
MRRRGATCRWLTWVLSCSCRVQVSRAGQTGCADDHAKRSSIKYDGTKTAGSHILRYGIAFNHIQGFTFEPYFSTQPAETTNVSAMEQSFAANSCGVGHPCFPGGISNPLNYPVEFVTVGNGAGIFSELPAFGHPTGGLAGQSFWCLYR